MDIISNNSGQYNVKFKKWQVLLKYFEWISFSKLTLTHSSALHDQYHKLICKPAIKMTD